jgi:uncharacterized Zn finger protein (UPF0148 family)
MVKHKYKETKVMTALGDYEYVYLCENCGSPEFDNDGCTALPIMETNESLEKALKALALKVRVRV